MKFLHLADLHIGKQLLGFSLLEDQKFILDQIVRLAAANDVDAVLICGDVYDRSVPSALAVGVLDEFLYRLHEAGIAVCMISGNHDSSLRLEFGARFFARENLFIHSSFHPDFPPVVFSDAFSDYYIWMVPFVRPADMQADEDKKKNYTQMYESLLSNMDTTLPGRHILMGHQFFTGGTTCESEELTIGTLDNISTDAIQKFDYAAFGHLHSPQKVGSEHARYAGSPLKYSVSEWKQNKSVPLITMEEDVRIDLLPISPLRDLRVLQGKLDDLVSPAFAARQNRDDYLYVLLEDEMEKINVMDRLRDCYPNVLGLKYLSAHKEQTLEPLENTEELSPLQIISLFYEKQKGTGMQEAQLEAVRSLWEENDAAD